MYVSLVSDPMMTFYEDFVIYGIVPRSDTMLPSASSDECDVEKSKRERERL